MFFLPFHDDEKTLGAAVRVLVDVDNVHDVPATADAPVQLHLAARFYVVV